MTRVYIVEDDPLVRLEIAGHLQRHDYEVCGEQGNATLALKAMEENKPDLVLLDIQLDAPPDGIWLAEQLHKRSIPFLFLTSYSDQQTFDSAKRYAPLGYILKPFSEQDLKVNIGLAVARMLQEEGEALKREGDTLPDRVFVKTADGWDGLETKNIDYLEACDNYLLLHLGEQRTIVRSTMKGFLEKLPAGQFVRCHRSYAVNPSKIRSITATHLILENRTLPLSKNYRDAVMDRLTLV